jgi:hypothetical protein
MSPYTSGRFFSNHCPYYAVPEPHHLRGSLLPSQWYGYGRLHDLIGRNTHGLDDRRRVHHLRVPRLHEEGSVHDIRTGVPNHERLYILCFAEEGAIHGFNGSGSSNLSSVLLGNPSLYDDELVCSSRSAVLNGKIRCHRNLVGHVENGLWDVRLSPDKQ